VDHCGPEQDQREVEGRLKAHSGNADAGFSPVGRVSHSLTLNFAEQGFSLYLVLLAKNYFYECKAESRFLDLTIVCNIMYSSGPPDLAGVFRRLDDESVDVEKAEERHDVSNLNRSSVAGAGGARSKKKGDKPQDKDQRKWAPLHFFVPATAGSLVAMTNKLGSWNMGISPGFKLVSDYMYHYECRNLNCLITEYDENNASRYPLCSVRAIIQSV
jgi:hypothetical protein